MKTPVADLLLHALAPVARPLAVAGMVWLGASGPLAGQNGSAKVSGVVRNEEGAPIPHVQISIPSAGKATLTDSRGVFSLSSLPLGGHVLHVARIGYAPVRREVRLAAAEASGAIEITLTATPLSLPGIHVTGTMVSKDPLAVVQATTQLAGGELQRELGSSIAQTLKSQPGIAMRSMGPGATMPVMRGLTGDRILILQDGQRTADLAGSADDHGVTIDPLVVERVEVIRGPATLLYGNNALGGVVNVISGDIPTHVPERAEWTVGAQTESAFPGGSGSLKTRVPLGTRWALNLRGGGRSTEDMRIPDDPTLGTRLANTDARSWGAGAGLGYANESTTGGASVQVYDFAYGLPVPPEASPVSLRGRRYEGSARADVSLPSTLFPSLKADGTLQDYSHDELDDAAGQTIQTFVLGTRAANLVVRQGRLGPLSEGAWGVSGLFKGYAATGPAALTPQADSRGIGAFGFEAIPLGGPTLELGGRMDDFRIISHTSEKFGAGRERVFRALSGSMGLRMPLREGVSAAASVARSFRAPTVEELFSAAAHAGTGAVEFGNPGLDAERGVSIEGVLRIQNARWNGQLAAYRNQIGNYVHLAARGDTLLYGVRLPILTYAQDEAVLRGAEGSVEWAATRTVVVGAMGDYLHAERANGTPLSFMPPPRVGLLGRWDNGSFSFGGDVHHELRQDRVGAADELPTNAHTILRLHAAARFYLRGQYHSLSLRAENLGNELHREATSRIKDFAPGAGRNLALMYRVQW